MSICVPKPCNYLDNAQALGAVHGIKRWRAQGDRIYTWDFTHGEIEVFNKRGLHIGVINCDGDMIKDAVKGRRIDV
jgi:Cytotoxic